MCKGLRKTPPEHSPPETREDLCYPYTEHFMGDRIAKRLSLNEDRKKTLEDWKTWACGVRGVLENLGEEFLSERQMMDVLAVDGEYKGEGAFGSVSVVEINEAAPRKIAVKKITGGGMTKFRGLKKEVCLNLQAMLFERDHLEQYALKKFESGFLRHMITVPLLGVRVVDQDTVCMFYEAIEGDTWEKARFDPRFTSQTNFVSNFLDSFVTILLAVYRFRYDAHGNERSSLHLWHEDLNTHGNIMIPRDETKIARLIDFDKAELRSKGSNHIGNDVLLLGENLATWIQDVHGRPVLQEPGEVQRPHEPTADLAVFVQIRAKYNEFRRQCDLENPSPENYAARLQEFVANVFPTVKDNLFAGGVLSLCELASRMDHAFDDKTFSAKDALEHLNKLPSPQILSTNAKAAISELVSMERKGDALDCSAFGDFGCTNLAEEEGNPA